MWLVNRVFVCLFVVTRVCCFCLLCAVASVLCLFVCVWLCVVVCLRVRMFVSVFVCLSRCVISGLFV